MSELAGLYGEDILDQQGRSGEAAFPGTGLVHPREDTLAQTTLTSRRRSPNWLTHTIRSVDILSRGIASSASGKFSQVVTRCGEGAQYSRSPWRRIYRALRLPQGDADARACFACRRGKEWRK
eukprot:UN14368